MESALRDFETFSIKQYRGVIFDLDGTLIDSMGMWSEIDVEYLGRFGIEVPKDLQKTINGMQFTEVAVYFREHFGIRDSVEKIGDDWLKMARDKYEHTIMLKPGAYELLSFLKNENIPCAIASSNHYDLIEAVLRRHGVLPCFKAIVTCDDVCAGKPDPAVYLKAAKMLHVPAEDCLVFEDVPVGVMAGKRAGMDVCAVLDPHSADLADEVTALADFAIDDFFPCIP